MIKKLIIFLPLKKSTTSGKAGVDVTRLAGGVLLGIKLLLHLLISKVYLLARRYDGCCGVQSAVSVCPHYYSTLR